MDLNGSLTAGENTAWLAKRYQKQPDCELLHGDMVRLRKQPRPTETRAAAGLEARRSERQRSSILNDSIASVEHRVERAKVEEEREFSRILVS
jgi:hypothetical protein